MKRIVVLCDGTWNSPDMSRDTTHVDDLRSRLINDATQKVRYFKGVGTNDPVERGGRLVGRGINKLLGGATGFGLGKKVREAYTYIAEHYEDGDEIYLFGFSRGAYTARSVAGMIRKCGIVSDTNPRSIRKAYRLYRKAGPKNAPDEPHIQKKRMAMSPDFATSSKDQSMRSGAQVPIVNIAYLGVWDTVGQLGLPQQLFGIFAVLYNARYAFHDTQLSSLVKAARHAIAVDERRVFYKPAVWKNLDDLNQRSGGTPFAQCWFVGDHAVVGGSASKFKDETERQNVQKVSNITLKWVAAGASALRFRTGKAPNGLPTDATADIPRLNQAPNVVYEIAPGLLERRQGVDKSHVDTSVRDRVRARPDYRPESLSRLISGWLR